MDSKTLPRPNTFSGLSLILDRVAERRENLAWVAEQAASPLARFILLDGLGETYLRDGAEALRWLDWTERESLLGDLKASLLGFADGRPHFMLALDDADRAAMLEQTLGARRASLRDAGMRLPAHEAGLFA